MAEWICVECDTTNPVSVPSCRVCTEPAPPRPGPADGTRPASVVTAPPTRSRLGEERSVEPADDAVRPLTRPPEDAEASRSAPSTIGVAGLLVLLLVLVGGVVLLVPRITADSRITVLPGFTDDCRPAPERTSVGTGATAGLCPTPVPTPTTGSPTATVDRIGLVELATARTDLRVEPVASLFDVYFTSINQGDYSRATSVFARDGVVDPEDPDEVQAFARALSTTHDRDVTLHWVNDGPDPGTVLARLTFTSTQASGKGPHGRESETCTRWNVTYLLREVAVGAFRLVRSVDPTLSEPCPGT